MANTPQRKAVIHIGGIKTGSTAIQQSLAQVESARVGYRYLERLDIEGHLLLGGLYGEYRDLDPYLRNFFRDRAAVEAARPPYIAHLSDLLRQRPHLVLSSEFIASAPRDGIRRLKADLCALGIEDFRVVYYVREPSAHYLSNLQEFLKNHTDLRRFLPQHYRYEFRRDLSNWEAEFPGHVRVRPFERAQLIGGSVTRDFHAQLSAFLGEPDLQGPEAVANESIGSEALFTLQAILGKVPELDFSLAGYDRRKRLREKLEALSAEVFGAKSRVRLHPPVAETVHRLYDDDLAWLASTYGITLSGPDTGYAAADAVPHLPEAPKLSDIVVPPHSMRLLRLMGACMAKYGIVMG